MRQIVIRLPRSGFTDDQGTCHWSDVTQHKWPVLKDAGWLLHVKTSAGLLLLPRGMAVPLTQLPNRACTDYLDAVSNVSEILERLEYLYSGVPVHFVGVDENGAMARVALDNAEGTLPLHHVWIEEDGSLYASRIMLEWGPGQRVKRGALPAQWPKWMRRSIAEDIVKNNVRIGRQEHIARRSPLLRRLACLDGPESGVAVRVLGPDPDAARSRLMVQFKAQTISVPTAEIWKSLGGDGDNGGAFMSWNALETCGDCQLPQHAWIWPGLRKLVDSFRLPTGGVS